MRQEILGSERRRQWSDSQKRKIIEEIGVDGASVAEVARRHDLTRSIFISGAIIFVARELWRTTGVFLFYRWRWRLLKRALLPR